MSSQSSSYRLPLATWTSWSVRSLVNQWTLRWKIIILHYIFQTFRPVYIYIKKKYCNLQTWSLHFGKMQLTVLQVAMVCLFRNHGLAYSWRNGSEVCRRVSCCSPRRNKGLDQVTVVGRSNNLPSACGWTYWGDGAIKDTTHDNVSCAARKNPRDLLAWTPDGDQKALSVKPDAGIFRRPWLIESATRRCILLLLVRHTVEFYGTLCSADVSHVALS